MNAHGHYITPPEASPGERAAPSFPGGRREKHSRGPYRTRTGVRMLLPNAPAAPSFLSTWRILWHPPRRPSPTWRILWHPPRRPSRTWRILWHPPRRPSRCACKQAGVRGSGTNQTGGKTMEHFLRRTGRRRRAGGVSHLVAGLAFCSRALMSTGLMTASPTTNRSTPAPGCGQVWLTMATRRRRWVPTARDYWQSNCEHPGLLPTSAIASFTLGQRYWRTRRSAPARCWFLHPGRALPFVTPLGRAAGLYAGRAAAHARFFTICTWHADAPVMAMTFTLAAGSCCRGEVPGGGSWRRGALGLALGTAERLRAAGTASWASLPAAAPWRWPARCW